MTTTNQQSSDGKNLEQAGLLGFLQPKFSARAEIFRESKIILQERHPRTQYFDRGARGGRGYVPRPEGPRPRGIGSRGRGVLFPWVRKFYFFNLSRRIFKPLFNNFFLSYSVFSCILQQDHPYPHYFEKYIALGGKDFLHKNCLNAFVKHFLKIFVKIYMIPFKELYTSETTLA